MVLCKCFETSAATCKHYQKSFTEQRMRNKRDRGMSVHVFVGERIKISERVRNGVKQLVLTGAQFTLFILVICFCLHFLNSTIVHPPSVHIMTWLNTLIQMHWEIPYTPCVFDAFWMLLQIKHGAIGGHRQVLTGVLNFNDTKMSGMQARQPVQGRNFLDMECVMTSF